MSDDNKQQFSPNPIFCSPEKPSQFDLVLKNYGEGLTVLLKDAADTLATKTTEAGTRSGVVCTDRKITDKLAGALKEYSFLSICIGAYASKDLELLPTIVQEDVNRYEALKTSYSTAVAAIKTAKQKIARVNDLANKLKNAVPDSCNSEELKQIKECLQKSGNKHPKGLEESVNDIVRHAHHLTNLVDDLSESAVKVAGINAFINIGSLSTAANNIKEKGNAFIANVNNSITTLQASHDASRTTLTEDLKLLSTATADRYKAWIRKDSLAATAAFVKDTDCDHDCRSLDDIAKEAEQSFNNCCGDDDENLPGKEAETD